MDADVCPDCGSPTGSLEAALPLSTGTVTRRWLECHRCDWESSYVDTVTRPGLVTAH